MPVYLTLWPVCFPHLSYNCMFVCLPFALPTFLLVWLPASLLPCLLACLFLCLPVFFYPCDWLLSYQNLSQYIFVDKYLHARLSPRFHACLSYFLSACLSFLVVCRLSVCLSSYSACLPAFPQVTCVLCCLPVFQTSAHPPAYMSHCQPAYLLPACLMPVLLLSPCLPACLRDCLPACLPNCLYSCTYLTVSDFMSTIRLSVGFFFYLCCLSSTIHRM